MKGGGTSHSATKHQLVYTSLSRQQLLTITFNNHSPIKSSYTKGFAVRGIQATLKLDLHKIPELRKPPEVLRTPFSDLNVMR